MKRRQSQELDLSRWRHQSPNHALVKASSDGLSQAVHSAAVLPALFVCSSPSSDPSRAGPTSQPVLDTSEASPMLSRIRREPNGAGDGASRSWPGDPQAELGDFVEERDGQSGTTRIEG